MTASLGRLAARDDQCRGLDLHERLTFDGEGGVTACHRTHSELGFAGGRRVEAGEQVEPGRQRADALGAGRVGPGARGTGAAAQVRP